MGHKKEHQSPDAEQTTWDGHLGKVLDVNVDRDKRREGPFERHRKGMCRPGQATSEKQDG